MTARMPQTAVRTVQPTPAPTPARPGVLQRKCACGGNAGPTGACAECSRKRRLGNERLPLQTKLIVNEPGDKFEREADQIADQVMRMPDPALQRQVDVQEEDDRLGTKPVGQWQAGGDVVARSEVPPIVYEVLRSPGQPLDATTRPFMEHRFEYDFSDVRVHTDARAAESAQALNARAYTVGQNVVLGAGQYAPQSEGGRHLLAHELTHVVQQNGVPLRTRATLALSDDTYEQEAAQIAEQHGAAVSPPAISEPTSRHQPVHRCAPGGLLERQEAEEVEQQAEIVFSVAEAAWGWEHLQRGFQSHRTPIREFVKNELDRYAVFATLGAERGVSDIFQPYEEDLIWDGADASAVTALFGQVPIIGGAVSATVGTIMASEMAHRNIQINHLKSTISSRLEDEINAQLIDERTPENARLMTAFARLAAGRYLEILNERGRGIVPEHRDMEHALIDYLNKEIVITSSLQAEWQCYVKKEYGPIVDRALGEPEPRECPSCHDIRRESEEAARRRRLGELFRPMEALVERGRPQFTAEEMEALQQWIQPQ